MNEKRQNPRAILLWNTVVRITPRGKSAKNEFFAVLRDISLVKEYCNGFGFECKAKDAGKVEHDEKADIQIILEIKNETREIDIPVVIIKSRGKSSLGARMDRNYEKAKEKHPLIEVWLNELKKEGRMILPGLWLKVIEFVNSNEFHESLLSSTSEAIIKKLPGVKKDGISNSSLKSRIIRFLKADYDFKAGKLRKDYLKTCIKKKTSLDLDSEVKWKGIVKELAEKKADGVLEKDEFKEWI